MINYINAELYRTRKNTLIYILIGLGIFTSLFIYFTVPNIYSASYISNVTSAVREFSVIIAMFIIGLSLKTTDKNKNYIQKGLSRVNIILGDFFTIAINTIIFAIFNVIFTTIISLTLDTLNDYSYILNFIKDIAWYILMIVAISIIGIFLMTLFNNILYTNILLFVICLLIPQLSGLFMVLFDSNTLIFKISHFITTYDLRTQIIKTLSYPSEFNTINFSISICFHLFLLALSTIIYKRKDF